MAKDKDIAIMEVGIGRNVCFYKYGNLEEQPRVGIVVKNQGEGTVDLLVFPGGKTVTNVRHYKHPMLVKNPNIAIRDGMWAELEVYEGQLLEIRKKHLAHKKSQADRIRLANDRRGQLDVDEIENRVRSLDEQNFPTETIAIQTGLNEKRVQEILMKVPT